MLTYLIMLCVFLGGGLYWDRYSIDLKVIASIFLASIIFIFMAFKYDVGTDSVNYLRIYNDFVYQYKYSELVNLRPPEVMYSLINLLSVQINGGMLFVYTVCGAIISFCVVKSCSNLGVNPFLYLAIIFPSHFVMLCMSGIRQGVAGSLAILAYSYILKGNKAFAFFVILFATTFHSSCIVFLSLLFIDLNKKYIFALAPLVCVALIYFSLSKYGIYFDSGLSNAGIVLRLGFYLCIVVLLWILIYKFRVLLTSTETHHIYYFNVSFVAVSIIALLSTTLADRLSYYLIVLSGLLLVFLVKKYNVMNYMRHFLNTLLLASMITLIVFGYFGNNINNYRYDNYIYRYLIDGDFPKIDSRNKIRGGALPGSGEPYDSL